MINRRESVIVQEHIMCSWYFITVYYMYENNLLPLEEMTGWPTFSRIPT